MRGSVANDIAGMGLAVLAIAMLIALVSPSSAVITHATERFLTLCFGIGAVLCPLSLLLFSLTFFIEGEEPLGTRAALGLALMSVAILALISLFVPGAELDPDLVINQDILPDAGGMVGGGIAWVLLKLVGRPVGLVLLVGLTLLGAIICGFSVSGFFVRLKAGAVRVRELREDARRERSEYRESIQMAALAAEPQPTRKSKAASLHDGQTSFIGDRKTTVLTRRRKSAFQREANGALFDDYNDYDEYEDYEDYDEYSDWGEADPYADDPMNEPIPQEPVQPAKTQRKRHAKEAPKKKTATPRTATAAASSEVIVPEFLRSPKAGTATRSAKTNTRKKAKTTKAKKAANIVPARPGDGAEGYVLPDLSMLASNPNSAGAASSREELDETMTRLQGTLREFGLTSRVVDYISGPIVTTFRVEMGEGERVNRIRNLEDDIALTLAAEKVRIFAPIPGTSYVGIEIPNKTRQNVFLGDVLPYASGGPLEVAIGRDSSGKPVVADIARMPHMLVAGTTGSGKSVLINSMIMSLLMRTTPKQVRLIMIDPKRVEFSCYNGLPHLYVPVVTEPRQAASALQWAVSEMERRLKVFERAGAREINVYNNMCVSGKFADMDNPPEPMPYLVVIIDELSDLMMVAGKDVEASIVRIAQLARAPGIHLVIATQRPSANVVTGLIKSNIDNRVALKVSSGIDSRVILDEVGAERLLGNGDMLFKYRGINMQRVLGCFTSDDEINEVVDFIRSQAEPDYHEEILTAVVPGQPVGGGAQRGEDDDDPLVWEAAQIVVESRLGSTSGLQRRLKVGYARAGRIMDMLEAKGVVGPPDGSKPREVLLDEDGLEELRVLDAQYREVV